MEENMDWLTKLEQARTEQKKSFILDIIPTSYSELDKALGVWGIPRGKIVEISGHAGVGKTALLLDIVAQAQEHGLNVVYMDLDRKFDAEFAKNRAVKCEDLLVFQPDATKPENTLKALEALMKANLIDLIVFDTISAYGDGITEILQGLAKNIAGTKITILLASQIRQSFEDPRDYNTPYMHLLNQYCNIRIMLKKIESIKHDSILIGKRIAVDVYKNVMAHPRTTEIEIYI